MAPAVVVRFVARQLGVAPAELTGYGERAQTRTDHVNQVKDYLRFRSPTAADLKEVRDWLAAEAVVQDRPVVLACERRRELRVVRPGWTVIEQSLVGGAREAARRETAARATWLRRFAVAACPRDLLEEIDKLVFLVSWAPGSGI